MKSKNICYKRLQWKIRKTSKIYIKELFDNTEKLRGTVMEAGFKTLAKIMI